MLAPLSRLLLDLHPALLLLLLLDFLLLILLLTPFAASPRLEFDRIKLGQSGVRRLIVRNPG